MKGVKLFVLRKKEFLNIKFTSGKEKEKKHLISTKIFLAELLGKSKSKAEITKNRTVKLLSSHRVMWWSESWKY